MSLRGVLEQRTHKNTRPAASKAHKACVCVGGGGGAGRALRRGLARLGRSSAAGPPGRSCPRDGCSLPTRRRTGPWADGMPTEDGLPTVNHSHRQMLQPPPRGRANPAAARGRARPCSAGAPLSEGRRFCFQSSLLESGPAAVIYTFL